MRASRFWALNVALALVGLLIAGAWIYMVGGLRDFTAIGEASPPLIAAMLGLTGVCVFVRFLRWQFLMRHAGVRLPERPSLQIYLASLVGTATPAYVGEVVRGVFLKNRFGVPVTLSVFVLVFERLFDVLALVLLAVLAAEAWWLRSVLALIGLGAVAAGLAVWMVGRAIGVSDRALAAMRRTDVFRDALLLSIGAWALTGLHVWLAASSLGLGVSPVASLRVFTSSVLLGGLSLMPAGLGTTGSIAILMLEELEFSAVGAVMTVALVRLTTAGATLVVGATCLTSILTGRPHEPPAADAAAHFDAIANDYGNQFRPHVWTHLLNRKVAMMAQALSESPDIVRGLDLGCGLGVQCLTLQKHGYRVIGMDISQQLAREARRSGASVTAGSALALPFRDQSLDFVYAIGVLHHLPDRRAQHTAMTEINRVLRPGGLLLVHETNTRNPLFRLYMGYIFPLLKRIDEGTEWWIEPGRWNALTGLRPVGVQHFTFMPDFVPASLMRPALAIDRWLEASRWRTYSVHYLAVLRRDETWAPAVPERFEGRPVPAPAEAAASPHQSRI